MSVLPLDLDALVAASQDIVHVRCTGISVQRDAQLHALTVTTFVVLDRPKGNGDGNFTVRQAGGKVDDVVVDYHVPQFRVGEEYVLFMPPSSRLGLASPVGLAQGAFGVVKSARGKAVTNGQDFAELLPLDKRSDLPASVLGFLAREPGARRQLDLADFMAVVRAKARRR
jgi:hypothetical protein